MPCRKFEAALSDGRMRTALRGVTLVRVDVDEFDRSDLNSLRLDVTSVPWFFKVDSRGHPTDAISSGEWDEDIPENIAPVMRAFVDGEVADSKEITPALHKERATWWKRMKWAASYLMTTTVDYTVTRRINFGIE